MLERLIRFTDRICTGLALLAGVVLILIAAYAVLDALGRKILSMPLPGAVDIVSYGLGIAIALGLPYCTLRLGHVSVPALTDRMQGILRIVPLLGMALSLLFLAVLAYQVGITAERRLQTGDEMWMLKVKTWPVWYLIAAMSVFAGFCQLLLILATCIGLPAPERGSQNYE